VTHLSEIIECDGDELIVVKKTDYELETLGVKLPALITTRKEMNVPRQMNAFEIWRLDQKKVVIKTFDDLSLNLSDIGLLGSPTKVKKTYTRPVTSKAPKVEMNDVEAAKKIVELLYPYMEVKSHG
jgi:electron transfer flavoprotein beta subunit